MGPCSEVDGRCCRVGRDHWRQRTTGPGFPLLVMRCRVHGRGFTLYPPGHVPYGRRRVAPVGPDGAPLRGPSGVEAFRGTPFEAALDLAGGERWPRDWERQGGDRRPDLTTQWRWVHRMARLTAVAPEVGEARRRRVALGLGVATLFVHDQAARAGPGLRYLAHAIVAVLAEALLGGVGLEGLLAAGALVGLWGGAQLWDAATGAVRAVPGTTSDPRAPP